jgi:hypothetical protein
MTESLAQLWDNFIGRGSGPMKLRLFLQPSITAFFAIRAGLNDARENRRPYAWKFLSAPEHRGPLLREAWDHIGKIFLVATVLDGIYQFIVFHRVYLTGAITVAVILTVVPYLLLRGLVNRIASLRASHKNQTPEKS